MATRWYGKAVEAIATKKIDLVSDDIKVLLLDGSYTPNEDTHTTISGLSGQITGTGYTQGGRSLTGKTFTQNAGSNKWTFDADDITWTGMTATFRYAVLFDDTDPNKSLIGYVDFGTNQVASGQDVTIKWEYVEVDDYSGEPVATHYGILEMGY